jgi:asparagine synthase (glutamine-hydrolysing)
MTSTSLHAQPGSVTRKYLGGAVHLYALTSGDAGVDRPVLRAALLDAAADFHLDPATFWQATSVAGDLMACGIHHAADRCGPRRYVHQAPDRLTCYDGMPVAADRGIDSRDAAVLADRWGELHEQLEGQFTVLDLDLLRGSVTILTDTLGHALVFAARRERGLLISNSLAVLAALLSADTPDPLGVSSFLALGWCTGDSTLTRGIGVLAGGARHTVAEGEMSTRRHFGPATVPTVKGTKQPVAALAEQMTELMRRAVGPIDRVESALTAGRDTRVMTALLLAAGEDPLFFTGGTPDSPDVVIACELAALLGLRHRVMHKDPGSAELDWTEAASIFMRQNHGLVSLLQLRDYTDLTGHSEPLGVKLSGVGGEIGRAGTGPLSAIATNVPLLRRSARLQSRMLQIKIRDPAGLMTPAAHAEIASYLRRFEQERLAEGWRPFELQEAFYTFERVGRWGAGLGRVAGTEDLYSPFCSRPFINHCFSRRSGERYVEAIHYGLLAELSPPLLAHRFEVPLRPQHPRLAGLMATRQLAGLGTEMLAARMSRRTHGPAPKQPPRPEYPFQHAWLEQRLDLARDIFDSATSDLWAFISRERLQALLDGTEADRIANQEGLLRALTVAWHLRRSARPDATLARFPVDHVPVAEDGAPGDEGRSAGS